MSGECHVNCGAQGACTSAAACLTMLALLGQHEVQLLDIVCVRQTAATHAIQDVHM